MKTVSVLFELEEESADGFLAHLGFLKSFLASNEPADLAELFETEEDRQGFLQYGLPYVEYLKALTRGVHSAAFFSPLPPERMRRKRKNYTTPVLEKELSPSQTNYLEKKLFGRILMSRPMGAELRASEPYTPYRPWYAEDERFGVVLQFLSKNPSITKVLSSEELEDLVHHIIMCAKEFPIEAEKEDALSTALKQFPPEPGLQLPYPLSRHFFVASAMFSQKGQHPSQQSYDTYKEGEHKVIGFIFRRTTDQFGAQIQSEYQIRIITGFIGVLIGIFKTEEVFLEQNAAASWHEYLAANVKNQISNP